MPRKLKISPTVGNPPKQSIFSKLPHDPLRLSKIFFRKRKLVFPTKTIDELEVNDFIGFHVIDDQVVVKMFGVFKVVPNDIFLLEHCRIVENVPKTSVYQVQQDSNGKFLQGIREGFRYS